VRLPSLLPQVMHDEIGNVAVVLGDKDPHVAILCGGLPEAEKRQRPVGERRNDR
jgi:hypothetical protein